MKKIIDGTPNLRKNCAFVIHMRNPADTLRRVSIFFEDRGIPIELLNMHRYVSGDAILVVHCSIEKDRIPRTVQLLEKIPGICELERMEGKENL